MVREVVRGYKHNLRKSANRNAQISVIHSAHYTDLCFAICRFSQVVFVTSNNFTHNLLFLFPIVFSINLILFFNICSVLAVLSPGLFRYVLLYMCCFTALHVLLCLGHCAVATVAVCGFGSWSLVFDCGMARQISPLPPTPSQTEVCSTMGESIRPFTSSFHNPTPSADKHVVQICRSSLSAAVQTV